MAKPFYSMDEVCKMLGRDQDGVKALVREGKLREFRDAGKIFFKADDVDKLAGKSAAAKEGTGEIMLEAGDDELPSLADVSGTGTSMIGLAPVDEDDDQKKKKEGTVITASGIGVFDDDELEIETDPMAKTTISAAATDQVSLEGTGSGSGLLDLTRESDDTSLGAELLDEIYPGEEEAAAKPAKPARREEPAEAEAEPEYAAAEAAAEPVMPVSIVAAGDPAEGMMCGLSIGSTILLLVAGSVVAGVLQDFMPDYARFLSNNFWYFVGGAAVLVAISLGLGALLGKAAAPRRAV
ncbi:MAG: helix-turn-helix domain-containing protein [Planctomycetes bacterium]|nr:helix-turn-helix domain-containing protein [Planctomycetota bacterium]